jgi:hypothetical protein
MFGSTACDSRCINPPPSLPSRRYSLLEFAEEGIEPENYGQTRARLILIVTYSVTLLGRTAEGGLPPLNSPF